ncbi:MAG TPA: hypothetical protein VHO27_01590 [Angustibacter sp.]|nr:hypothetical protein [Angustibacter sp.]
MADFFAATQITIDLGKTDPIADTIALISAVGTVGAFWYTAKTSRRLVDDQQIGRARLVRFRVAWVDPEGPDADRGLAFVELKNDSDDDVVGVHFLLGGSRRQDLGARPNRVLVPDAKWTHHYAGGVNNSLMVFRDGHDHCWIKGEGSRATRRIRRWEYEWIRAGRASISPATGNTYVHMPHRWMAGLLGIPCGRWLADRHLLRRLGWYELRP